MGKGCVWSALCFAIVAAVGACLSLASSPWSSKVPSLEVYAVLLSVLLAAVGHWFAWRAASHNPCPVACIGLVLVAVGVTPFLLFWALGSATWNVRFGEGGKYFIAYGAALGAQGITIAWSALQVLAEDFFKRRSSERTAPSGKDATPQVQAPSPLEGMAEAAQLQGPTLADAVGEAPQLQAPSAAEVVDDGPRRQSPSLSVEPPSCPICGQPRRGPLCNECGAIVGDSRQTTLYAFVIHRRAAMTGALATFIAGALITFTWQTTVALRKVDDDASQVRRERVNRATAHLAAFRTALWQFISDCVPRSIAEEQCVAEGSGAAPLNSRLSQCRDTYKAIVDGYLHWTWAVPEFIADLRRSTVCEDIVNNPAAAPSFVKYACGLLRCSPPLDTVSQAYRKFTNDYARYARHGVCDDLAELRGSTKTLFTATRQIGCATLIAGYRGHAEDYSDSTGYCARDFAPLEIFDRHGAGAWQAQVAHWKRYPNEIANYRNPSPDNAWCGAVGDLPRCKALVKSEAECKALVESATECKALIESEAECKALVRSEAEKFPLEWDNFFHSARDGGPPSQPTDAGH